MKSWCYPLFMVNSERWYERENVGTIDYDNLDLGVQLVRMNINANPKNINGVINHRTNRKIYKFFVRVSRN